MTENKLITLFTYKEVEFFGIDTGDNNIQVCLLPICKFLNLEPLNTLRSLENGPLGEDVGRLYAIAKNGNEQFWDCVSLSNTPKLLTELDFKSLSYTNMALEESSITVKAGILHWCFTQLKNASYSSLLGFEAYNPFQLNLFQEVLI